MINQKLADAVNAQINAELYSSYLYFSMAAYFEAENMPGAANWLKVQALEELTHADKFYAYVVDRGGRVLMSAIDAPPTEWDSPLAAFEAVLEHEEGVTARINQLVDLAGQEKDHATSSFLQWFVNEQVEEEKSAADVITQMRLAAQAPGALFMIDRELGARVFTPPAAATE